MIIKILAAIYNSVFVEPIRGPIFDDIEFLPVTYPEANHCFSSNDLYDYTDALKRRGGCFTMLGDLIVENRYSVDDFRITDIGAIGSSKSSGKGFDSVEKFGESVFKREGWSVEECYKDLERNATNERHLPIDIKTYRWNGIFKWSNHDGSHHMAAAIYQLLLDPLLPIKSYPASIIEYSIDKDAAEILFEKYGFFVINNRTWWKIYEIVKNFDHLPKTETLSGEQVMIAIDKQCEENYVKKLSEILHNETNEVCINVNEYIFERVDKQDKYRFHTYAYS